MAGGLGLSGLAYYPGWIIHEELLRFFSRAFFWVALLPAGLHALVLVRTRAFGDSSTHVLAWLVIAQAIATLYLFLGDPRVRLPFDPIVLAVAADACSRVLSTVCVG